jgi:hypothetical protein
LYSWSKAFKEDMQIRGYEHAKDFIIHDCRRIALRDIDQFEGMVLA